MVMFDGIRRRVRRFSRRIRSEKAENTITTILVFPLLWCIIMTIIDFGVFNSNGMQLRNDLRDGARTAAIFGGTNNKLTQSYGTTCGGDESKNTVGKNDSLNGKYGHKGGSSNSDNLVTCLVANKINNNPSYINMKLSNIQCGPSLGEVKIGQATWCQASYDYQGMPGSALSLFGIDVQANSDGKPRYDEVDKNGNEVGKGVATTTNAQRGTTWNKGTIRASAQSEVTMTQNLATDDNSN